MTNILFVDDEPEILEGLRNMLRRQRSEWNMVFTDSALGALDEMTLLDFDIVVTDMRMPGMDGAELLDIVRQRYPKIARMILTGHADQDSVLRALRVSQKFLSKPCSPGDLKQAIESVLEVKALPHAEGIEELVGAMEKLPTLPQTYSTLSKLLSRPGCTLEEISAVIQTDPCVAVKILQIVNSSFFGRPQQIESISAAISYLGTELLKVIVIDTQMTAIAESVPACKPLITHLQSHSEEVLELCRQLLDVSAVSQEVITVALIHDIGKIVMMLGKTAEYQEIRQTASHNHCPLVNLEEMCFGFSHAKVGAFLVGMWGLPPRVVESVAFHHHPSCIASRATPTLAAIHLAEAIVESGSPSSLDGFVDEEFLKTPMANAMYTGWLAKYGKFDRVA